MRLTVFSLVMLCGSVAGADDPADRLQATAEPARFSIKPLAAGTNSIVPPELTVELTIEAACASAGDPESLLVSIADTRLRLGAAELEAPVRTRIVLPRAQLAPIRIDGFCRQDEAAAAGDKLVNDAYTARISLRCAAGDQRSVVYQTLPVSLRIHCDAVETGIDGSDATAD